MKILTSLVVIMLALAALAIVPIALVWTVKQWQLIINDQLNILTWDAWVTGLCTLCIIDGMRRIKMPN